MTRPFLTLSADLLRAAPVVPVVTSAYFALVVVTMALVPHDARPAWLGYVVATPLAGAVFLQLAILSFGAEARMDERRSGLPRRLFLLPLPSWMLVSPALVWSPVVILVGWMTLAVVVMPTADRVVPLFWPGVALAASFAWVQALSWMPLPLWWLRLWLVVLLTPLPLAGAYYLDAGRVPEAAVCAAAAIAWLAGTFAGVGAVKLARIGTFTGDAPREAVPETADAAKARSPLMTPFRTRLAAHLWSEWRMMRIPLLVTAVFSAPALWWMMTATSILSSDKKRYLMEAMGLGPALAAAGPGWMSLAWLLTAPMLATFIAGNSIGRFTHRAGNSLSTFHATLPIDEREILRLKLLSGGLSLAAVWAFAAILGLAFAAWTGQVADMASRLGNVPGGVFGFAAATAVVVGLTALVLLAGVWAGFVRADGYVVMWWFALVGAIAVCRASGVLWRVETLWVAVGVGLAAKVALTGWAVSLNGRDLWFVAAVGATWLAVTAALVAVEMNVWQGLWVVPAATVVVVPLGQPLLALAAIRRARHG